MFKECAFRDAHLLKSSPNRTGMDWPRDIGQKKRWVGKNGLCGQEIRAGQAPGRAPILAAPMKSFSDNPLMLCVLKRTWQRL